MLTLDKATLWNPRNYNIRVQQFLFYRNILNPSLPVYRVTEILLTSLHNTPCKKENDMAL